MNCVKKIYETKAEASRLQRKRTLGRESLQNIKRFDFKTSKGFTVQLSSAASLSSAFQQQQHQNE